ncbi:MAG: PH domain-containing protein [Micrococcus sp.]|nr:PH domain-containing protein [Micrococcus sp.]
MSTAFPEHPERPAQTERPGHTEPAADAPEAEVAVVDSQLPTDDAGWTRMHPLSPLARSWAFVLVVVFVFGRGVVENTIDRFVRGGEADRDTPEDWVLSNVLLGLGIFLGVALLVAGMFFLSWWFTKFRLEAERLSLREGWLFRSQRHMRYDRIQAVDLQFPLVARLLGLAKVRIEAADGGESALELVFLKRSRAEEARREILDQVAGRTPAAAPGDDEVTHADPTLGDPGAGVPGADSEATSSGTAVGERLRRNLLLQDEGTRMLRVPPGRLIGSILLSPGLLGTLAVVGGILGAGWLVVWLFGDQWSWAEDILDLGWGIVAASTVPIALGVLVSAWGSLNKGWGFTVFHTEDGLRLTYGLTESTSQTIPPGRVQGVLIRQPLFWRPFGWYSVKVMVAGYGELESGGARNVALPVGPWEDVLRVLTVVVPDPGLDRDPRGEAGLTPAELMRLAAVGIGEEGGFTHIPQRAAWYFHWHTWRRNGFTTTPTLLIFRSGRLGRKVKIVPHERIEAAQLGQGPLQRRLRVASVVVYVPGRIVPLYTDDIDADTAHRLFEDEAQIAAVARRYKDRNQWMRTEELERFNRQLERMGQAARGGEDAGDGAALGAESGAAVRSAEGEVDGATTGAASSSQAGPR